MAAAIMSTVSSLLNSSSTIFTIDIYQQYIRRDADQSLIVRVGRWSHRRPFCCWPSCGAPFILLFGDGLFVYIQDMASYFAPPIAAIFLVGILWKRMNALAANVTLIGGIVLGIALKLTTEFFPAPLEAFMAPFLNRALVSWLLCLLLIVIVSLASKATEAAPDSVWRPAYARLPEEERKRFSGWKSFYLWWGVALALRILVYIIYG